MNNFFDKISNGLLAILLAVMSVTSLAYFTSDERLDLISASILDGLTEADISDVEFVVPKGAVYPTNGVVTITSVYVETTGTDGIVSGTDLENSFITFGDGSNACAGAVYNNNKIILPDTFNSACSVDIFVNGVEMNETELMIEPLSCASLETNILRGYGSGFENIDSGSYGEGSDTETAGGFDFNAGPGNTITSVDLNYPSTQVAGAQTFQIHLDFVPDVSVNAITGIDQRAEIVENNGDGNMEIKVREEGVGNEAETAANFMYVFNDLLGTDSPFIAYHAGPSTTVHLKAIEWGTHGDFYQCMINGAVDASCAFADGAEGINEAAGVLTVPLTLDKEIVQGETAIVFANGSFGEIEWISSHTSLMDVVSLTEASQDDASSADFVDVLLDDGVAVENIDKAILAGSSYNIPTCEKVYDENTDTFETESCTVDVSIFAEYDISGIDYTVNVSVADEVVPVTVQGSKLTGFITGSGTYTTGGGLSVSLSGDVIGVVSGSVAGQYSGTVSGQVSASINSSTSMAGLGVGNELDPAAIELNISNPVGVEGTITDIAGTFTSTVKKEENDLSHVAILYGKRPGNTILTAVDEQGCIASFDLTVVEKQVVLQAVGFQLGDVLDVADVVQVNAFVGAANAELEEYENISAASGIEWFSSNEEVATIDGTGLLTALKPGVTNITARYDTGDTEIGTIESQPMQITVNKIADLRISFDEATENALPASVVNAAYESVVVAVHSPESVGQVFTIEGQTVTITLPAGTYSNEISQIEAIVDQLETDIAALTNTVPQAIVTVSQVQGYPGMLILQPLNQALDNNSNNIVDIDENGIMDIDTTALETHVSILPTFDEAVTLPSTDTYGLRVVAQYDNGATELLPATQFTWVNTPVNYLEQASLDTGILKYGEIAGTSTVLAEFLNADGSIVQSNYLTVEVEQGPSIDYVHRIGTGNITKGARINLRTKVTDVDTIADISNIETSIVFSNETTYNAINADASALWFTATTFFQEVEVEETSGGSEGEEGEEGTEGESGTTTTTTALPYGIYNIPVEIPVDANLFDGVYKLILSITDKTNRTLNYVYPIRIGNIGEGDVNGDGVTNMVDVIIAFQIASGALPNPTPSQLEAANVDGIGGVTLIDVIILFNLVTN